MSVMGYLDGRSNDLRMPKEKDPLGIIWKGPVLSGRMGVREAIDKATLKALKEMEAKMNPHYLSKPQGMENWQRSEEWWE